MEQSVWEKAFGHVHESIEQCIREVMDEHYSLGISASSLCNASMTSKLLKKGSLAVRFNEALFGVEGYITFEGDWFARLAQEVLGVEERGISELTQDLAKDFSLKLIESVRKYIEGFDVEPDVSDIELLKHHQIKGSLDANQYYTVRLEVLPGEEEKENLSKLSLMVALSQPGDEAVEQLISRQVEEGTEETKQHEPQTADPGTAGEEGAGQIKDDVPDRVSSESTADDTTGEESKQYDLKDKITKKIVRKKTMSNEPKDPVKGYKVEFEEFDKELATVNEDEVRNIDILKDVELELSVELGRKEMSFGDILKLVKGSVIELEKLAGEPVEILVNGFPIAQGEVVVIDEHFGVRVSNLVSRQERIKGIA